MGTREQFCQFLEEYAKFIEEMASQEIEKYSALLSYDHKRMDKAIAAQQAMNMRFSKLEAQRAERQEAAGFGEMTFQQILSQMEGEERRQYYGLFERIRKAVEDVKFFNGKSLSFARAGMQAFGGEEEDGQSYTADMG